MIQSVSLNPLEDARTVLDLYVVCFAGAKPPPSHPCGSAPRERCRQKQDKNEIGLNLVNPIFLIFIYGMDVLSALYVFI